jgi:hypothetical protein
MTIAKPAEATDHGPLIPAVLILRHRCVFQPDREAFGLWPIATLNFSHAAQLQNRERAGVPGAAAALGWW